MTALRQVAVACCVCGGNETEPVARGWDFEYATTREEFGFGRCRGCGHLYLSPRPAPETLDVIYPSDYYAYDLERSVNPLALGVKRWLESRKLERLLRHCTTPTPRFLDVGCGDGRLLDALAARGVPRERLWGVELAAEPVAALGARGYHAHRGRIEELELPAASFDLIVMLQVIEHVADPAETCTALARLLAPGGLLVIETPNARSLDARVFRRRYWGGYHFPRHWNLFDATTLERLGRGAGLEPVGFESFVCAVFWIYPLHHWLRERGAPSWLYRWFWPTRNVPLLAAATLLDLALAPFGLTSNLRGVFRRRV